MKRSIFDNEPVFCFTADIDWVSDPVIEHTQKIFDRAGIVPTYFSTHHSPFLDELIIQNKADCGIHPNFLKESSHGDSFDEVCNYFDRFNAQYRKCFRSHRYFDVTDINMTFKKKGYLYDSNLFTFMEKMRPYRHFSGLMRFPCCWEDGTHLRNDGSLNLDDLRPFLDAPGLTVMSVHPLHMAINSPDFMYSRSLKDKLTKEEMNLFSKESIENTRFDGPGISLFFEEVLSYVQEKGYKIHTLDGLYRELAKENGKK